MVVPREDIGRGTRCALCREKRYRIQRRERKDAGFRSALCAAVGQPDLKPFVSRNLRQFMPEEAQYAYMATRAALEHARLEQDISTGTKSGSFMETTPWPKRHACA